MLMFCNVACRQTNETNAVQSRAHPSSSLVSQHLLWLQAIAVVNMLTIIGPELGSQNSPDIRLL